MQKKNTKRAIATYAMVSALILSANALPIYAAGEWKETNGIWNYTNENKVLTGWQSIDNNWYAFDETGAMQTGWIASSEHWYYLGASGIMQSDAWVNNPDGSKYYIKGTGVMAADYVKDGYELSADGKAVALADSKSVVLTGTSNLEGTTIEGNLYVDATLAKELLIKGVTVNGKLVLLGDNKTQTKLTITDSNINAISTQTRDSEIVLSGTTTVKNVVLEETTKVTPDVDFKGKVDKIEVQSTTKGEVVISVPAKEVTTRTFATVDIQAPVDKLAINTNTTVNINADIKEVTINKFAEGTKVEVSKGNTVGTIETEVKVEVGGAGNVDKVTGAGKDESIITPKPEKPSTGGGSSSGGSSDPTPSVPDGYGVSTIADLEAALLDTTKSEIYLKNDITLTKPIVITRPLTFNGNGKKLAIPSTSLTEDTYESAVVVEVANNVTVKNLTVEVTGNPDKWQGYYGIQVYGSTGAVLNNITATGADGGILINGSTATLTGTTNVSGNEYGGIEVSNGTEIQEDTLCTLTLGNGATLVNTSEYYWKPTLWVINKPGKTNVSTVNFNLNKEEFSNDESETKDHYFIDGKYVIVHVDSAEELIAAMDGTNNIDLNVDIALSSDEFNTAFVNDTKIDLSGHTLTFTGADPIIFTEKELYFANGKIVANDLNASRSQSLFSPETGATLTLDIVDLTTNSVAIYPRGDTAEVNVVEGSTITAGVYGIGTNAAKVENYGVLINISDSTIVTTSDNGDNSAVIVNIPCELNIEKSTLEGDRHGLIVRGGTANVTDSTIKYNGKYSNKDQYFATAWGTGNEVPSAPVVIGNVNAIAYKYESDVTFTNVTITGSISGVSDEANGKQIVKVDVNVDSDGNEYAITFNQGNIADDMIFTLTNLLKKSTTNLLPLELQESTIEEELATPEEDNTSLSTEELPLVDIDQVSNS